MNPVVCQAGETLASFTVGGVTSEFCGQPLPNDAACDNILGYVNDTQVCGDSRDACESTGGTYGSFNGEDLCLNDVPAGTECSFSEILSVTSGGFSCSPLSPVDDPDNPDTPNSNPLDDLENSTDIEFVGEIGLTDKVEFLMIEALASGTPVITNRIGAAPENGPTPRVPLPARSPGQRQVGRALDRG